MRNRLFGPEILVREPYRLVDRRTSSQDPDKRRDARDPVRPLRVAPVPRSEQPRRPAA